MIADLPLGAAHQIAAPMSRPTVIPVGPGYEEAAGEDQVTMARGSAGSVKPGSATSACGVSGADRRILTAKTAEAATTAFRTGQGVVTTYVLVGDGKREAAVTCAEA